MATQVLYEQGWFGISLSGTPGASDAKDVYGVPDVRRVPQVVSTQAYNPWGDVRPDGIGRVTARWTVPAFRFKEFTVPSSGSTRPDYHAFLVCTGHKPPSAIADYTSNQNEDTTLRGDGSTTRFRFFTKFLPDGIVHVTDGTQTATASGGTFGGDGTGTYDNATGYVDVTFSGAPTNGATITVRYTGGYNLTYEHSRQPQSLSSANVLMTKLTDDGAKEEVRQCTGARGNLTLSLSDNDALQGQITGVGIATANTVDASPTDPQYTEADDLIWDETCTIALYKVAATVTDDDAFAGQVPGFGLDAGFEIQEPRGAITPGYTPAARLVPRRSTFTLTLPTTLADELDLEAAMIAEDQFHVRAVLKGRSSTDNRLGFTFRGQIVERGEPQAGFGGVEHVTYTFKCVTPGNKVNVAEASTIARYTIQTVTV